MRTRTRALSMSCTVLGVLAWAPVFTAQDQKAMPARFDGWAVVSSAVPEYPAVALSACVQGTVAIVVGIDKSGAVTATDTLFGAGILRGVAEGAAKRWVFERSDSEQARRQVLKFSFTILPRNRPESDVRSFAKSPTEMEVRSYPGVVTGGEYLNTPEALRRHQLDYERSCTGWAPAK